MSDVEDGEVPPGARDTGYAPGRWAFDNEVTRVFDDMLKRSIPQYAVMREAVATLATRFVTAGTEVIDLGCSRGEALAPLVARFGAANRFVGLEISESMLRAARERFARYIDAGVVDIRKADLRLGFGTTPATASASVILSVLTLQFVPIEYRQSVLRSVYGSLLPGGAFVFVEKIIGEGAEIDEVFVETYHGTKLANGYTREEIDRKRLALEGVLVPVTAGWNVEMLRHAGFERIDCFWRWMNFAGWLALKVRS